MLSNNTNRQTNEGFVLSLSAIRCAFNGQSEG